VYSEKDYSRVSVLIVGAGPAGLAAAISLKTRRLDLDVCVIDKADKPGNHNLSGAVLEIQPLHDLLDHYDPKWPEHEQAKHTFERTVEQDDVRFFLGRNLAFCVSPMITMAKWLHLGFGQMIHKGDYIVSVSKLTAWLSRVAKDLGVEVIHGFSAADILVDPATGRASGVKLVDQGLDHEGHPQRNYVPGETISADLVILAEGCDGLLTEKYIEKAGLQREANKLFSVGAKELIEVTPQQYEQFGDHRVVHAMGWPIWTPLIGPGIFGGGIMYAFGKNQIAVGMIVGADWKYYDFNPQEALVRFKQHKFVKQFIDGGTVVEAGAKMIPEGGYYAIPRDPQTNTIGKSNVLIIGDSAGFVNMLKIKGLHNAIASGDIAGQAAAQTLHAPDQAARTYTQMLDASSVNREMYSARKYRQTVAKLGNAIGFPVSTLGPLLPRFHVERDFEAMTTASYKFHLDAPFDKDSFTAMAGVKHREDQPCHCQVRDPEICQRECLPRFQQPCIRFCPAGVYEVIQDRMKPANPSNCLHCKTCQNKCPFDNLRWTVPEGAGGPGYRNM